MARLRNGVWDEDLALIPAIAQACLRRSTATSGVFRTSHIADGLPPNGLAARMALECRLQVGLANAVAGAVVPEPCGSLWRLLHALVVLPELRAAFEGLVVAYGGQLACVGPVPSMRGDAESVPGAIVALAIATTEGIVLLEAHRRALVHACLRLLTAAIVVAPDRAPGRVVGVGAAIVQLHCVFDVMLTPALGPDVSVGPRNRHVAVLLLLPDANVILLHLHWWKCLQQLGVAIRALQLPEPAGVSCHRCLRQTEQQQQGRPLHGNHGPLPVHKCVAQCVLWCWRPPKKLMQGT
mmetsp:Transcript_26676/g.73305  ORF Transcript_26676/g.73305 Transcript_26676/m.73305 type:complete len:295 (-) Transcript_26676:2-886(-)